MSDDSYSDRDYDDNQPQNISEDNANKQSTFVVPDAKNKLKACLRCHLLKTEDQWSKDKRCENCGPFNNWNRETTEKYDYIASIIDSHSSWLRRKIKLPYGHRLISGAYAVFIHL